MPAATLVLDAKATLGEGPIWDERENVLWWVDINEHRLHKFDPAANSDQAFDIGQRVGTVVPRRRGGLMLAVQNGFAAYEPTSRTLELIADPEPHLPGNRFNDGKCDPAGRFWAGTLEIVEQDMTAGTLYCLHPDGRVEPRVPHVGISNGIVWSADNKTIYYIDTPTGRVDAFDYDNETGAIANRRPAVHVPDELGHPDGMTIDAEDNLWVAMWGGWAVVRFDPRTGSMLEKIDVPAAQVTSCAFGGPELADLYITTARRDLEGDALIEQPAAGGLFHARVGATGVAAHDYAG